MLATLKKRPSRTGNTSPIVCSHNDYDKIKTERDKLRTKLGNKWDRKERKVAQHFNNVLELNLEKDTTLPQVINRLQELLRRPSSPKVSETPFGEDLATIREIDLVMLRNILPPLTKTEIRAIERATNYQELANARSEILSQALGKGQEQIKTTKQTNHQLINQQQKERIMWLI